MNLEETSQKTGNTIIKILREMLREDEDQRPDYASLFEMLSKGIEEEEEEGEGRRVEDSRREEGRRRAEKGWEEEGGERVGGRKEERGREEVRRMDERVKGVLENTRRLQEEFEREGLRDEGKEDLEYLEGKREELLKKSTLIKNVWKKEKENLGPEESVIESGKLYEVYMEEYNRMKAETRMY